jgi:hypothetical protein
MCAPTDNNILAYTFLAGKAMTFKFWAWQVSWRIFAFRIQVDIGCCRCEEQAAFIDEETLHDQTLRKREIL